MSKLKYATTILVASILNFSALSSFAETLSVPRFVSLKHSNTNARKGPGRQYPIEWSYKRKQLPIEIILEYADWRKVRDSKGDESWMHKSQLSGKRTAIVTANDGGQYTLVYRKRKLDSNILARLQKNAIVHIAECESKMCLINYADYTGWVKRNSLWGIYRDERID